MKRLCKSIVAAAPYFLAASLAFWADGANAQVGCTPDGAAITCTGDHSGGINFTDSPFSTLNVHSLSGDISTSGTNVSGIQFWSDTGTALALNSDTRPHSITTQGSSAHGIFARSRFHEDDGAAAFTGGDVSVFSADNITTHGSSARGIEVISSVQSVHGSSTVSHKSGNVSVTSNGAIATYGNFADAVRGSLNAYARVTRNGDVGRAESADLTIVTTGPLLTHGDTSRGIYATSRASGTAADGMNALAHATVGRLSIDNRSSIRTFGTRSHGIHAHSSGEGSSDEFAAVRIAELNVTSKDVETMGAQSHGVFVEYQGRARAMEEARLDTDGLTVSSTGLVSTHGDGSAGLRVDALTVVRAWDNQGARVSYGDIRVDNAGSIVTRGDDAPALFVSVDSLVWGSRGIDATFGSITINSREIRSAGLRSHGIQIADVYDLQGGGGWPFPDGIAFGARTINSHDLLVSGDDAHGIFITHSVEFNEVEPVRSADVVVNSTGTLAATGANAVGILVDSSATATNATNGDISINILGGSVTGGSGTGAAISLSNGLNNTISNDGEISALSGVAIRGGAGNEVIENRGTITGDILLGAGANAFNNRAGAHFAAGAVVDLGAGNTLTNDGRFAPGGTGTAITSALTGRLVQNAGATYEVDVDFGNGGSDRVNVSESAALAGTVIAHAIGSGAAGLSRQFLILSAAGGVTDSGLATVDTAAVDYSVIFDANGQDVYLGAVIDFATSGLNRNQTAIANGLNAAQAGGHDASMAPLMTALMALPTASDLARAYDQLSPEVFAYQRTEALVAAADFSNALMSCREAGGPNAAIREGECLWARARATDLDIDRTTENLGSQSRVGSFAAGLQVAMAADWKLGVAVGYDLVSLSMPTGATADGDRANVGAVVKYNPGPALLAAGMSAGWGTFDTDRRMAFGGFAATATSKSDADYVTGWLHAAYLFDAGGWYAKPLVDARITEIDFGGAREGGAAGLVVSGARDTVLSVSPALEIGREFRFDSVSVWRPFVRAGVTWHDDDRFVTQAAFAGAAGGVPGFQIATDVDDVLFDIGAGVDVIAGDGAVLRAQYDGSFGSGLSRNSVSLKGSVPF